MFIIVAGGGKVGYHLARALIADHEVLIMELDPSRVDFIAEELGSDVIMQGDASGAGGGATENSGSGSRVDKRRSIRPSSRSSIQLLRSS